MDVEQFFGKMMNEVEPRPHLDGKGLTMPMIMEFADWGMFRIHDDAIRYKFYDGFYKAFYAGKITNVDDIAAIGAKCVTNASK